MDDVGLTGESGFGEFGGEVSEEFTGRKSISFES